MTTSHRASRTDRTSNPGAAASVSTRVLAGVIGGLAGGAVFGVLMAVMGMLPMIASLVGSDSAVIGLGVHLVISVLIGLGLAVPFGNRVLTSYARGAVAGLLYGALWWVLGPLLIMPTLMGMPIFMINNPALMSLVGHILYGITLGLVATTVLQRRR